MLILNIDLSNNSFLLILLDSYSYLKLESYTNVRLPQISNKIQTRSLCLVNIC